jgi:hypothetical protein
MENRVSDKVGFGRVPTRVCSSQGNLWKTWNCESCYTVAAASSSTALAFAVLPASLRMDSENLSATLPRQF